MTDRSRTRLRQAIDSKPRFPLAHLPTPLEEAPRLSERIGARTLIKRDDQTGLALGGNKARKLEFLIADAIDRGADTIVTTGGTQSNHARMAAAAARLAGLACYLVLDRGVHPELQGNLLLDRLLGAEVQIIESQDPNVAVETMESVAEQLRQRGRQPYIIPRGGSIPAGATGYANFVPELLDQLDHMDTGRTVLFIATGSTGTHSGILAGLAACGYPLTLQGVSVSRDAAQQTAKIRALTQETLEHLGLSGDVDDDEIRVDDTCVGPGYGYPTEQTMEAIEILARDEGIILDPVYTGKAMAGLLAHARAERLESFDTAVYLHTGGSPALFAYSQEMLEALGMARA